MTGPLVPATVRKGRHTRQDHIHRRRLWQRLIMDIRIRIMRMGIPTITGLRSGCSSVAVTVVMDIALTADGSTANFFKS